MKRILNDLYLTGKRRGHIDEIDSETNIDKYFTTDQDQSETLHEYSTPIKYKTWFDNSGSLGFGVVTGLVSGLMQIINGPMDILIGALTTVITHDSDYLLAAIDSASQNTSGLDENIPASKIKNFQYISLGVSALMILIPGVGEGALMTKIGKGLETLGKFVKPLSKVLKGMGKVSKGMGSVKKIISKDTRGKIALLFNKIHKTSNFLETLKSNIDNIDSETLNNKILEIGKTLNNSKKGLKIVRLIMEDINSQRYEKIMELEKILRQRGLVMDLSNFPYANNVNQTKIEENIKIHFNAHSKSFWDKTYVSLGNIPEKSKVFLIGDKTVIRKTSPSLVDEEFMNVKNE